MTIFLIVLLVALIFEYINGFHDTANAIATVVSTKALTPRMAILVATMGNLAGAFLGTAVAKTVGTGFVESGSITMYTVLAGLMGGIIWNLLTWWLGIPSSSSHALVGGLCGAALAQSKMEWSVLIWDKLEGAKEVGLWPKLIKPMVVAPVAGFVLGMVVMLVFSVIFLNRRPSVVNRRFARLQVLSAAGMAVSHGMADAQKVMGILALALFTGTAQGVFNDVPSWLEFLRTPTFEVASWIKWVCALTMAAGTAAGGWRIIKTMGHKMVKMQPVHGFAAESTTALILSSAAHFGIPLSTTHVISSAIMGVGAMKRVSAVKWGVVGRIMWAWVLTLPATACFGYAALKAIQFIGIGHS